MEHPWNSKCMPGGWGRTRRLSSVTACMRDEGTSLPSGCRSTAEPTSALTETGDSSCSSRQEVDIGDNACTGLHLPAGAVGTRSALC